MMSVSDRAGRGGRKEGRKEGEKTHKHEGDRSLVGRSTSVVEVLIVVVVFCLAGAPIIGGPVGCSDRSERGCQAASGERSVSGRRRRSSLRGVVGAARDERRIEHGRDIRRLVDRRRLEEGGLMGEGDGKSQEDRSTFEWGASGRRTIMTVRIGGRSRRRAGGPFR